MSEVPVFRFKAPGPWVTRDLKDCVLASDYDALAAENTALREENERLTAANEARAEYLTTRRVGNDVDSYVNLAETKIEELRAQLAEAQEELAQWRATGESVTRNEHDLSARLAEVDAALGAWGRNEAGDAATIIRIAKAVGATDSATLRENERE